MATACAVSSDSAITASMCTLEVSMAVYTAVCEAVYRGMSHSYRGMWRNGGSGLRYGGSGIYRQCTAVRSRRYTTLLDTHLRSIYGTYGL